MSVIWDKISDLADQIECRFKQTGVKVDDSTHDYSWYNNIYTSDRYRRAHIEIVDNRETHKIYILHCTIFPHFQDSSPIWGFDAVCGPGKITGAFHDFSLAGYPTHPMWKWWRDKVKNYKWRKQRQLPEWAASIFSKEMVAAGNIQDGVELNDLCTLCLDTLDYYLMNVGNTIQDVISYRNVQNFYCQKQKENPHVINSMVSMGVPRETMERFVNEILFPETPIV